ncbi:CIP1 protein [Scheffersomyces coipomensis]|uniref:CIP1 protein n=1 Tax=Scheffersomyces coipomensis TaxID=1788519 RepID=UPI00315CB06C
MSKKSIAIIGISGSLGQPVLDAFSSATFKDQVKFPIKVISRQKIESTDLVEYIQLDLSEETIPQYVKELKGFNTIIELIPSNPTLFELVNKIIVQVKPDLFIPSQFGLEIDQVNTYLPKFLGHKTNQSAVVRAANVKVVELITGFFILPGFYLYEVVQQVGINPKDNSYEQFGDLNNKIAVNHVDNIASSIASLSTYPSPNELPDKVRIAGDEISFNQIIKTFEKNHNVTLTKKRELTSDEALAELKHLFATEGPKHEKALYYLHVVASQGTNKGIHYSTNENEIVNPGEKYWKWIKY